MKMKKTTLSLSGWHAMAVIDLSFAIFWNQGRFPVLVQLNDSLMAGLPEIELPLKDQRDILIIKVMSHNCLQVKLTKLEMHSNVLPDLTIKASLKANMKFLRWLTVTLPNLRIFFLATDFEMMLNSLSSSLVTK